MWERWNQTTHIFEKSDDNGLTWTQLPLSASVITEGAIPNVAYTNVTNDFTNIQLITHANAPALRIHNWAGAGDARQWGILVHVDGHLYLQARNDAGGFQANPFHLDRIGNITTTGTINTAGTITAGGNLEANGNIHNRAGYIYPGRADSGGAFQGSWYLASHASYGLYTATGIYANNFQSATLYYEANGRAVGYWTDLLNPSTATSGGGTFTIVNNYRTAYAIVGKTMTVSIYWNSSVTGTYQHVILYIGGFVTSNYQATTFHYTGGIGMMQTIPGGQHVYFYRDPAGSTSWTAGTAMWVGTFAFAIN